MHEKHEILSNEPDNFIEIPFSIDNLDRYFIRTTIKRSLQDNLPAFSGRLLDIGCGKMPYKKWILENSKVAEYVGLDIEGALEYDKQVRPDYFWNGTQMPFQSEHFDTAMATEVLEHCPEPSLVLAETFRVLKKGGCFFFTVPFLWNLHEVPNDHYRYTPFALDRLLKGAGFREIRMTATGGWDASLAQMMGLWVRRAPLTSAKRKWLSRLFRPVMKKLIQKDLRTGKTFQEGQMITGISGIAYK